MPQYRCDGDARTCRFVEGGKLPEHNATDTRRKGVDIAVPRRLGDSTDVEGVATAGVAHPVEQHLAGLFAQHHCQELADFPVRERRQLDARRQSHELGKVRTTRLVRGSQRRDHQQWTAGGNGRDVAEGLQRRCIGPLQVIDDHDGRSSLSHT